MGSRCCRSEPDQDPLGAMFAGMMSKEEKKKMQAEMKNAGMDPKMLNNLGGLFEQAFSQMGEALQNAESQMNQRAQEMKKEEEKKQMELQTSPFSDDEPALYDSENSRNSSFTVNDTHQGQEKQESHTELAGHDLSTEQVIERIKQGEQVPQDATYVDLSGNKVTIEIVLTLLDSFPNLESLSLACNEIDSLQNLAGYLKETQLKALNLGGNKFSVESLTSFLSEMKFSNLRTLELPGLELSDKGAIAVLEQISGSKITTLDLSLNKIHDSGFAAICKIGFEGATLILTRNFITHKTFKAFSQNISRFANLKILDLIGNQLNERESVAESFKNLERKDILFKIGFNKGVTSELITQLRQEQFKVEKGGKISEKELVYGPKR